MIKKFYSDRSNGFMSAKREFYDSSLSTEQILEDLKIRRKRLGELVGFDGTKILVPAPTEKKPFTYRDVTEMVEDTLSDDPEYDLWDLDIPCDIMIIRSNLKGIVLAYPVADCPAVIVESPKAFGIAHCSAVMIDQELPMALADAVSKVSHCKDRDLNAYISPCAGSSYIYETYPRWATNDDWDHFIKEVDNGYKIDLKKAIMSQLMERGVKGITTSTVADTITDPNFYSNYAYKHGDESKNGRFLAGAYYEKVKTR